MGENTAIEWAHCTFNPWMGCTKVSPGCAHCYAERDMDHRYGKVKWGAKQPRVRTSESDWQQPRRWDRTAAKSGIRPRVFCASLADVFDVEAPNEWRRDLLALIQETPNLDWLLLTKRPQNVMWMLDEVTTGGRGGADWLASRGSHVWIGTTVEDQERADQRIQTLLKIPARVLFLSCEPMVGPVDLRQWLNVCPVNRSTLLVQTDDVVSHGWGWDKNNMRGTEWQGTGISWVICGGESGPKARPMHPDWARTLRDQCVAAGVPYLFKQWGEWLPGHHYTPALQEADPEPAHSKFRGADWDGTEWRDVFSWADEPGDDCMFRVGKKSAGRELDGRTWDEVPA